MAKVISFISRKGGTGKTTNAIHLATTLAAQGHGVLLIETDTNYTLSTLRQMETAGQAEGTGFEILASEDQQVADVLRDLRKKRRYAYIVVDSAGKTTDEYIRQLCLESDLVVVPSSLTRNDVLVAYQTVEDLKAVRQIKENFQLVILPSRIHSQTGRPTIEKAFENVDAPVLPVYVPNRNSFNQFSTLEATDDYRAVAEAVLAQLK